MKNGVNVFCEGIESLIWKIFDVPDIIDQCLWKMYTFDF